MELTQLINTFKRWAWLLILGLALGLSAGYFASRYMQPVFETSTKLMISRSVQDENPDLAGLNSQQLVQTYIQLLGTKPLLDATMERAGLQLDSEQISVSEIPDTQIIEIKVEGDNPEKAAVIANTMVQVLIDRNEEIQTSQYNALESRLTKQGDQVKAQIDDLQKQFDQSYGTDYQDQLRIVDQQINEIQTELSALQGEMVSLKPDYSSKDRLQMTEKQTRVDQLQSLYVTYEQIRANLLVMKKPLQSGNNDSNPRLQQLQSTLDLYQKLNLTIVQDLENARLTRLQQAPTIVQIDEATIPGKPIRPILKLYMVLGGMVGLMLTAGLVFFIGILQSDQKIPDEAIEAVFQNTKNDLASAQLKVRRTIKTAKSN